MVLFRPNEIEESFKRRRHSMLSYKVLAFALFILIMVIVAELIARF